MQKHRTPVQTAKLLQRKKGKARGEWVDREPKKYEVTFFDNSPESAFSWERG
jgi:hypothetical protein